MAVVSLQKAIDIEFLQYHRITINMFLIPNYYNWQPACTRSLSSTPSVLSHKTFFKFDERQTTLNLIKFVEKIVIFSSQDKFIMKIY